MRKHKNKKRWDFWLKIVIYLVLAIGLGLSAKLQIGQPWHLLCFTPSYFLLIHIIGEAIKFERLNKDMAELKMYRWVYGLDLDLKEQHDKTRV